MNYYQRILHKEKINDRYVAIARLHGEIADLKKEINRDPSAKVKNDEISIEIKSKQERANELLDEIIKMENET